jgi:hypothetical protein
MADSKAAVFFRRVVKYRYFIALVLFAVLVLLRVNGSSLGMYTRYFLGTGKLSQGLSVGAVRSVRSDEWSVQSPYFIAQANSTTPFSVNNSSVTPSGQNMILSYGAPVWDISTLSKPLNWGYLFFGWEYGMSWYWCMKLLLLILLSFELCMIITQRNTFVSFLGSFWIALSPAVQWWFMQHVGDVVLYTEAVIVTFYYIFYYFGRKPLKALFALLFSLSAVGFVLTIYPAIQVPMLYFCVMLCVLIFTDFRKTAKFRLFDWLLTVLSAAVIVLILGHVYLISKDGLAAVMNTAYPGKRVAVGGEGRPFTLFSFLTNIFLPYKTLNIANSNNCEISSFYSFLPAVLLAFPCFIKFRSRGLKYGAALAVFSVLSSLYLYVKIPQAVSKALLLSYVTHRISIAAGFSAVCLSVWALARTSEGLKVGKIYSAAVSLAVGASYIWAVKCTQLSGYVSIKYYIIFIIVLVALNYLLLRGMKKGFALLMVPVILLSGATVNPVNVGRSNLFSNSLAAEIKSIKISDPDAEWLSTDCVMGTYLCALGAKTVGGTNYYPDMAKWKVLDPGGIYSYVYNRYVHIYYKFTSGETKITLDFADSVTAQVNSGDIEALGVRYILTKDPVTELDGSGFTLRQVGSGAYNGYYIYKAVY